MADEIDRYGLSAQFTFLASGKTITSLQAVVEHLRSLEQAVESASQAVKRSGLGTVLNQVATQSSQASQRINQSLNVVQQATQKAGKTGGLKDLRAEFRTLRAEAKAIDLHNLTNPQQVGQATQSLNQYIAELKRLESQLDKTTLEGREMAAQLQQQQHAAHRQIQKIATTTQQAQAQTQTGVKGIRAEFRALRAEAHNIDFGDLTDPDQFKAATHAIDQYIQELKRLEAQVDKTTLEGRELAANLQRQQTIAANRSQMAGAERKAATAQQRLGAAQAIQMTGSQVSDFFQEPRAAAIEFGQQLSEINKLADFGSQDNATGMKAITRAILEQSTNLSTASDELAAVYGNLAGAGKSFENTETIKAEADAILKNALALDISTDAATSLDIKLGSIYKNSLTSMGGIVKMNERMGSSFNALADNLPDVKIDAQGITDVFNVLVATVGDAKNFRPPDLSAFSAIMNSLEVTPDVAGSFVGRFDAAIAKKTDQFAKTLGMPLQRFRHMVDTDKFGVYQAIAKRYATMKGGDIEKANFLKSIGIDSSEDQKIIKGMSTQLSQMTDARRISNDAYKEAISTTTELNKVQKSGAFQTEKARIATENMKKALGLAINEALLPITTLTASFLEQLIKFTQDHPKLVGAIATTAYILGGLAFVAGTAGLAIFGLQAAMAQAEIGLVAMASKGIPLTGFFANTMAAFQGGGIIAGFGELGTTVLASGQAIATFATGPVGLAIAAFAGIIALLEILTPGFNVLGGMIGVVLSPLAVAFGVIKGVVEGVAIAFKPLIDQFKGAGGDGKYLGEVIKTAIAIFQQFEGVGETVGKVLGLVLGVMIATPLRALVTLFKGLVGILQTVGWVGQWLATPFTWAISMITQAWQGFVTWFSNMPLVKFALDLAQGLINALNHNPTERIPEAWETAISWIQETFGFLLTAAQTVGNVLVSILDPTRLFKGILSGLVSLVEGAVTTIQESGIGKLFDRMGMGAPLDAVSAGLDHLKAQLTDQPVTVPVEIVPTSDRPDSFLQRLILRRDKTAIAAAPPTLPPMPPPTAGTSTAIPAETILPVAQIQSEVAMTSALVKTGLTDIQTQWQETWTQIEYGANFGDLIQPAIAALQTQLGIAGQAFLQFVGDSANAVRSLNFAQPQESAIALGKTLLGVLQASGNAFGSLTLSAVTLGVFSLASLSPIVLVMGGIVLAAIAVATNFLGIRSAILGIVKIIRGMINVVRGGIELIQALITTIINAGRGIIQIFNGIPGILRGDFSQIRAEWDTLTSAFQVGGNQIRQAIGRMGQGVRQIFSGTFQVVHGLIDGLIRAVRDAGNAIKLVFKGAGLAIQGLGMALDGAKQAFGVLLSLPRQLHARWQQMQERLNAPILQAAIAHARQFGKTVGTMVQAVRSRWQQVQTLDEVPILGMAIRQIRYLPDVFQAAVTGAHAIWQRVTQLDEVPILQGAIATLKRIPDIVQGMVQSVTSTWQRVTQLDDMPILPGAIATFKRVPEVVQDVVQLSRQGWQRITSLDDIPVISGTLQRFKQVPETVQAVVQQVRVVWSRLTGLDDFPILQTAIATFKRVPDIVQMVVHTVLGTWQRLTDLDNLPILSGAIATFKRLPEIAQTMVQTLHQLWTRVTHLDEVPILQTAIATFKRVPEIVQSAIQSISATWQRITDLDNLPILQGFVQFVKSLPELFSGAIAQIKQLWSGLGEKVTSVFGFMKGKSKQTGEEMVSNLAENSPGPTYQIRMKWGITAESIHAKLQALSGQAQAAGQELATHLEGSFNQVQAIAKTKLGQVGAQLHAGLSGKGAGAVSRSLGSVGMVASNFAPQLAAPLFVVNDLIDASQSLSESLPEAKKFFVGLLPKVTKLGGGLTKLLPLAMTGFTALGGVFSAIAPIATAALAAITGPLLPIIAGVVGVVAAIWLLRPVFKAVFGVAGSILKGVVGTIAAISEGITTLATTITNTLSAPFQLLEGGVKRLFGGGGDAAPNQPKTESSGKLTQSFSPPAIAAAVATPYFPEPDYGQTPVSRYAVDWGQPMPSTRTPVTPDAPETKPLNFPELDQGQVPVSRYANPTIPIPAQSPVSPSIPALQPRVQPIPPETRTPNFPELDYGQVPVSRYAMPEQIAVSVVANPVVETMTPVVQQMQAQADMTPVSVAVLPTIAQAPALANASPTPDAAAIAIPMTVDAHPAQAQTRRFFDQVRGAWAQVIASVSLDRPFESAIAVGGSLLTQLQSVGHQFGALTVSALGFGLVSLASLSPVVLVLGGVALAALAISTNFLGIRDVIAGLVKLVKGLVTVVTGGLQAIAALSQLIVDVGRGILRVFAAIPSALRGDFSQIGAAWEDMTAAIRSSLRRLGQAVARMVQGVRQVFAGGAEAISGLVQGVIGTVRGLVRLLGGLGRGAARSLDAIRAGFGALPAVVDQVVGTLTATWRRITNLDEIPMLQGAIATVKRLPDLVQGTVQSLLGAWKRVTELDHIPMLTSAIALFKRLPDLVQNIVQSVLGQWKRITELDAVPILQGAIAQFKRLPETVQSVMQSISATWHRITELEAIPVLQGVVQFVKSLPELFSGAIAQIKQLWSGLGEKVTSVFGFMKGRSKQTGDEMISNLAENSPGPTYQIRMKWGITAENIHAKLQTLSGQAQAAGQEFATHLEGSFNQVQATAKTKLGQVGAQLHAGLSGKGAGAVSRSLGSVGMVASNFAPQLAAPLFVVNDLIDASQSLSESLPEAKKFFVGLLPKVTKLSGGLIKLLPLAMTGFTTLGGVFSAIAPIATAALAAITGPLLPIIAGVVGVVAAIWLLRPVFKAVFGVAGSILKGIVGTIAAISEGITTLATTITNTLSAPFQLLEGGVKRLFGWGTEPSTNPSTPESSGKKSQSFSESSNPVQGATPLFPEMDYGQVPVSRYASSSAFTPVQPPATPMMVATQSMPQSVPPEAKATRFPEPNYGQVPVSRYADPVERSPLGSPPVSSVTVPEIAPIAVSVVPTASPSVFAATAQAMQLQVNATPVQVEVVPNLEPGVVQATLTPVQTGWEQVRQVVMTSLQQMGGQMGALMGTIASLGVLSLASLSPMVLVLGGMGLAVFAIATNFLGVRTAIGGLVKMVQGVIVVIRNAISIVMQFAKMIGIVGRGLRQLFAAIPATMRGDFSLIQSAWRGLIDGLMTSAKQIRQAFGQMMQGIRQIFVGGFEAISGVVDGVLAAFRGVLRLLGGMGRGASKSLGVIRSGLGSIPAMVDQVVTTVRSIWRRLTELDQIPILQGAIATFKRLPDMVPGIVQSVFGSWRRLTELDNVPLLQGAIAQFKRLPETVQSVMQSISATWHRITELEAIPVLQGVVQFVKSLPELFSGAIAQIKQLWSGLGEKVTSVFGFMKGKSKQTGDEMISNLAENSPGPTYQIRMKWGITAENIHAKLQTLSGQAQAAGQEFATHLEGSFNQVQATAKTKLGQVGAHIQTGLSGKGAGAVSQSMGSVGMVLSNFAPQLAAPLFVMNDVIDASQSLSESLPEAKKFFVGVGAHARTMGGTLAKVVPLLSSGASMFGGAIATVLPLLSTGFAAIAAGMSAILPIATAVFAAITGPLLPIVLGVGAIAAALFLLRPVIKAVFGLMATIVSGVVSTLQSAVTTVTSLGSAIASAITQPFTLLKKGWSALFGKQTPTDPPTSSGKSAPINSSRAPENKPDHFPELSSLGQAPTSRYSLDAAPFPAWSPAVGVAAQAASVGMDTGTTPRSRYESAQFPDWSPSDLPQRAMGAEVTALNLPTSRYALDLPPLVQDRGSDVLSGMPAVDARAIRDRGMSDTVGTLPRSRYEGMSTPQPLEAGNGRQAWTMPQLTEPLPASRYALDLAPLPQVQPPVSANLNSVTTPTPMVQAPGLDSVEPSPRSRYEGMASPAWAPTPAAIPAELPGVTIPATVAIPPGAIASQVQGVQTQLQDQSVAVATDLVPPTTPVPLPIVPAVAPMPSDMQPPAIAVTLDTAIATDQSQTLWSQLRGGVQAVGTVAIATFSQMSRNAIAFGLTSLLSISPVVLALGAVVLVAIALATNFLGLRTIVMGVGRVIQGVMQVAIAWIRGIGQIIQGLVTIVRGVTAAIRGDFSGLREGIGQVFGGIRTIFSGTITGFQTAFSGAIQIVQGLFQGLRQVVTAVGGSVQGIGSVLSAAIALPMSAWQGFLDLLRKIQGKVQAVVAAVQNSPVGKLANAVGIRASGKAGSMTEATQLADFDQRLAATPTDPAMPKKPGFLGRLFGRKSVQDPAIADFDQRLAAVPAGVPTPIPQPVERPKRRAWFQRQDTTPPPKPEKAEAKTQVEQVESAKSAATGLANVASLVAPSLAAPIMAVQLLGDSFSAIAKGLPDLGRILFQTIPAFFGVGTAAGQSGLAIFWAGVQAKAAMVWNALLMGANWILSGSFVSLATAAIAAWGAILAPILPIVGAIAAVVGAVLLLKAAFDFNFLGIRDLFVAVWEGFQQIVGEVVQSALAIFTPFVEMGRAIAATFLSAFASVGEAVSPILGLFGEGGGKGGGLGVLVSVILFPVRLIAENLKMVFGVLAAIARIVTGILTPAFKVLALPIQAIAFVLRAIIGTIAAVITGIQTLIQGMVSTIGSVFSFIYGLIPAPIRWIIENIGGGIKAVVGWLTNSTPATPVQKFASGGTVQGQGSPTGDRIPILSSPGEFVVNAAAARNYYPELQQLNDTGELAIAPMPVPIPFAPPTFSPNAPAQPSAAREPEVHVHLNFAAGAIVVNGDNAQQVANDLIYELTPQFQYLVREALRDLVDKMK